MIERFRNFTGSLCTGKISRRRFFKHCLSGLASLAAVHPLAQFAFAQTRRFNGRVKKNITGDYDLVVVKGEDPYLITFKAIATIGGIERFVKKGSVVVIKPNIAWDRKPEYGATTNPYVVAALVELCFKAGAKRVRIFDIPCNAAERCYDSSGIKKAAQAKGADVYFAEEWNTIKARFDYESPLEGWPIFRDAIECDTFINVPVLKHHSLTGLTVSMKNLMGVCCGDRGLIHYDIGRKLVDLTDFINPELTVVDAYRVLVRHGPSGGNLNDVVTMKTIIAATDPTLADSYACTLVDKSPLALSNIAEAVKRNFGSADIKKARLCKLNA